MQSKKKECFLGPRKCKGLSTGRVGAGDLVNVNVCDQLMFIPVVLCLPQDHPTLIRGRAWVVRSGMDEPTWRRGVPFGCLLSSSQRPSFPGALIHLVRKPGDGALIQTSLPNRARRAFNWRLYKQLKCSYSWHILSPSIPWGGGASYHFLLSGCPDSNLSCTWSCLLLCVSFVGSPSASVPPPAMLVLSFLLSDFSWLCVFSCFLQFLIYIGVYPITHPVILSDGQQRDSVIYVHDISQLWIQGLIASTSWSSSMLRFHCCSSLNLFLIKKRVTLEKKHFLNLKLILTL